MPIQTRAKLLGGCCLLAVLVGGVGAMGCHHDHDDYDRGRQSGYYQGHYDHNDHAYDYDHNRGDHDRGDYDRGDHDRY